MELLLAGPRAFCAGVERAIDIVRILLARQDGAVYVRRQIVHNVHVVRELEEAGAVFVEELDEVPDGVTVVFSAHGVSPAVRAEAERRQLRVVDATCPLVAKVHAEARRFAARGDTIVLIGHIGHDEAVGTMGEAPSRTVLVETVEDVERLEIEGPVSYLMQTTLAMDDAAPVLEALRRRFPRLRGPHDDDICYATTNRQQAVREVAAEADVVLVLGSANSANSVKLMETARRQGARSYLVDDASQVRPEWLAGARVVGVTAGASASPALVDELVAALRASGASAVVERVVVEETVTFAMPRQLRTPTS